MVWLSFKSPDDTNGFTKELRKLQSRENDLPTDELKLEYIKLTKKSFPVYGANSVFEFYNGDDIGGEGMPIPGTCWLIVMKGDLSFKDGKRDWTHVTHYVGYEFKGEPDEHRIKAGAVSPIAVVIKRS